KASKKFSGRCFAVSARPLERQGRGLGFCFFNPQSNPQIEWSCTTCAAFGSPRVAVEIAFDLCAERLPKLKLGLADFLRRRERTRQECHSDRGEQHFCAESPQHAALIAASI